MQPGPRRADTYRMDYDHKATHRCALCSSTDDVQGRLCRPHRLDLARRSEQARWARLAAEGSR